MNDTYYATKIRPALYKMSKLPWAWVSLKELAECLGMPIDRIWNRYKHISFSDLFIEVAWEDDQEYETYPGNGNWQMHKYDLNDLQGEQLETVFVPAGWSNAILRERDLLQTLYACISNDKKTLDTIPARHLEEIKQIVPEKVRVNGFEAVVRYLQ